jgi:hypothetical protein
VEREAPLDAGARQAALPSTPREPSRKELNV